MKLSDWKLSQYIKTMLLKCKTAVLSRGVLSTEGDYMIWLAVYQSQLSVH